MGLVSIVTNIITAVIFSTKPLCTTYIQNTKFTTQLDGDEYLESKKTCRSIDTELIAFKNVIFQINSKDMCMKFDEFHQHSDAKIENMHFDSNNVFSMTYLQPAKIREKLLLRYPNYANIENSLGIYYTKVNEFILAKRAFKSALFKYPNDAIALLYLGYMLYIERKEIIHGFHESIDRIQRNKSKITKKKIVNLMKFGVNTLTFFSGEANFVYVYVKLLCMLRRDNEADRVIEKATQEELFMSFWQRSVHHVRNIKSKPIWTLKETHIGHILEKISNGWKGIRKDALRMLKSGNFQPDNENLGNDRQWHHYYIYSAGKKLREKCNNVHFTCSLFESIPKVYSCPHCSVYFSLMEAGAHIFAHSGPTNSKLRAHVGLGIPEGRSKIAAASPSRLRVCNEYISWGNGRIDIFDDSFDHEVWHNNKNNHSRLFAYI